MNGGFWHTDELHVAKLLAVKRTVVTVSKWPRHARHTASKSMSAIGKHSFISDNYPLFCLAQLIIGKNLDLSGDEMRPQLFDQIAEGCICA